MLVIAGEFKELKKQMRGRFYINAYAVSNGKRMRGLFLFRELRRGAEKQALFRCC